MGKQVGSAGRRGRKRGRGRGRVLLSGVGGESMRHVVDEARDWVLVQKAAILAATQGPWQAEEDDEGDEDEEEGCETEEEEWEEEEEEEDEEDEGWEEDEDEEGWEEEDARTSWDWHREDLLVHFASGGFEDMSLSVYATVVAVAMISYFTGRWVGLSIDSLDLRLLLLRGGGLAHEARLWSEVAGGSGGRLPFWGGCTAAAGWRTRRLPRRHKWRQCGSRASMSSWCHTRARRPFKATCCSASTRKVSSC
jgi:hypothetical protein